jgi:hypothetical protein
MTVRLKISSTADWVAFFAGSFRLTLKEEQVISHFIDLKHAHPTSDVFSTYFRKIVSQKLNMPKQYDINGYIKALADKQAIVRHEDTYLIHPLLSSSRPFPTQVTFMINE